MNLINFFILFLITSCAHFGSPKKLYKLSILQGITNANEVEFSIMAEKNQDLSFELRNAAGESIPPEEIKSVTQEYSPYRIYKVLFSWRPSTEYNLVAYRGTEVIDQRLVGRGQKEDSKLQLAIVSSLNDKYEEDFKAWDLLAQKDPEYIIFAGDTVITDAATELTTQVTNPEILWNRYAQTRASLPIFFKEKLIPIHAIWDDHDFGQKNGNRFFGYKDEAREVFENFYAQSLASLNYSQGVGVGGLLSLGDFNLYFLDSRSYRSKDLEGNHLGFDQSAWFNKKIKEENTPSLIIKGDPFFGGYTPHESYEGRHPEDFKSFIDELKIIQTPVVFISGDKHTSEIMQFPRGLLGRPSFEITTGPMHDQVVKDVESHTNPWRVVSTTGQNNFTIVTNTAKDDHWFLDVKNFASDGKELFHRELAVFIKDLQDNLKEIRKRRHGRRRYRRSSRRGRR